MWDFLLLDMLTLLRAPKRLSLAPYIISKPPLSLFSATAILLAHIAISEYDLKMELVYDTKGLIQEFPRWL